MGVPTGALLRSPFADPAIKATYLGYYTEKGVFASTGELDRRRNRQAEEASLTLEVP
jgi:hypothetical protein